MVLSSIIDGRDFLKKDLCWQIGDGETARVWKDNWIPTIPNHRLCPTTQKQRESDQVGATLITDTCS